MNTILISDNMKRSLPKGGDQIP